MKSEIHLLLAEVAKPRAYRNGRNWRHFHRPPRVRRSDFKSTLDAVRMDFKGDRVEAVPAAQEGRCWLGPRRWQGRWGGVDGLERHFGDRMDWNLLSGRMGRGE